MRCVPGNDFALNPFYTGYGTPTYTGHRMPCNMGGPIRAMGKVAYTESIICTTRRISWGERRRDGERVWWPHGADATDRSSYRRGPVRAGGG